MPVVFLFGVKAKKNSREVTMRVNKAGQKIKEVPLIFLGMGRVGGALLQQILSTREALQRGAGIRFTIVGLADSTGALLDCGGLTDLLLTNAQRAKAAGRSFAGLDGALPLREIDSHLQPGTILVDATASAKTVSLLKEALAARCGIVLANKLPLTGPWAKVELLFAHPLLCYEATVGAGLPIISTLRTLLATGDRITSIEGVLSGTLAYLCTQLMRGTPYSVALAQARALGYTEPDPREDLSGRDVVRKALILARTAGWPLDEGDMTVEPLYPTELATLSVSEFLSAASTLDENYAHWVRGAQSRGRVLRYVARVGPNGGAVGVEEVEKENALGGLQGPENAVSFHTERYASYPLVVSGPGAGPQVTAAGVLGDTIVLAKRIEHKEEPE
jgi:homoserine dehydrogenase